MELVNVLINDHEVAVDQNEFGILVESFIRSCLQYDNNEEWLDKHIHAWWPKIEDYYHRSIICAIEVAIMLDEPPRRSGTLNNKEMWKRFVKELRDPRSEFTVDYTCSKCKVTGVKLWREYNVCTDFVELECATCLVPGIKVTDDGRAQEPPSKDDAGNILYEGIITDQIGGKVPAVPVGDTFWAYTSVPSQDVEWWQNLPTYSKDLNE